MWRYVCTIKYNPMETYTLHTAINTFYVAAKTFPDGITEAFTTLMDKLGEDDKRDIFGISQLDENGTMLYYAGAMELYDGEGEKLGCNCFVIPSGKYLTETIEDWKINLPLIHPTFERLGNNLTSTGFPLIEWYSKGDVRCMVTIK